MNLQRAGGWCKPAILSNAIHPGHLIEVGLLSQGQQCRKKAGGAVTALQRLMH